jgi:HD-like signal output (HDOD) protein
MMDGRSDRISSKKKIEINCQKHNKRAYELHLTKLIKRICSSLGLVYAEWDIDSHLYKAIKTHGKFETIVALFESYDKLYDVATELNVDLDTKFKWLHRINRNKNNKPNK